VLAYLSLGSNVGDRRAHLAAGLAVVVDADPWRASQVYVTEPVGGVAQADFWNLVVEIETTATPRELLARARAAEALEGRTREVRWGPRTLDVDVLLVGDLVSEDLEVLVPHPRMWERAFVVEPLRELAPGLVDPAVRARAAGRVEPIGTLASLQ
jgi:2-amino-4-hydroxy-6-hydroxymethyldihydropteridine diphosphokinase